MNRNRTELMGNVDGHNPAPKLMGNPMGRMGNLQPTDGDRSTPD